MKNELDYIQIEDGLGGNQDWFPEWDMYHGGCAAVTACDLCIYLALREDAESLYPYDLRHLNREDFVRFARDMKPYLSPRSHGIDFLEIYIEGLSQYWRDAGGSGRRLEGLSGTVPFEEARGVVREQLRSGLPVPYLMLRHQDDALEDFEWHWFNLAGYEEAGDDLMVEAVTYGKPHWLSLRRMWNSGEDRRGGVIRVSR